MTYTEALMHTLACASFAGSVVGPVIVAYLKLWDLEVPKRPTLTPTLAVLWLVSALVFGIPYLLMEGKL